MFNQYGYYKEYYTADKKFIGVVENVDQDRSRVGFDGMKKEIIRGTVSLTNGKVIKDGTEVFTILYPLNSTVTK